MLTKETLSQLSTCVYRADAKRVISLMPLGSIYWDDEMPDWETLATIPEADRKQIDRCFAIRMRLWNHESLLEDQSEFWESARSALPAWAIFRRLELSDDEQRERKEIERDCAQAFEEFLADADILTSFQDSNGFERVSATFRLNKSKPAHAEVSSRGRQWLRSLKRFIGF